MNSPVAFIAAAMFLLTTPAIFGQQISTGLPGDAFRVAYWGQPRVVLYGSEEQTFNDNTQVVMFARDDSNDPTDPGAFDRDVQWLKDHPRSFLR
jgi:hypothetical protein